MYHKSSVYVFLSCGDYFLFFLQIDRSVVESFGAGGKTCILSRVYPSLAIGNKAHLYVFNNGRADVKVSRLIAWEMKKPVMNGAKI
jgi:beta-fructofuranosidase